MSSIEYEMTYLRSPSPVRIPPQRTLSVNVRRLQEAVNTLLEEEDRSDFIEALNVYHSKRNVYDFVQALKLIFDNSVKRQIIPLLRKVMPHSDQDAFDQYMYNDPITSIPLNTPYLNQRGLRRTSSVPSQQPFSLRRTKSSEIIRRPSEPPKSKIYRQVNNTFDVEKNENNVVNHVTLKKNSSHEGWGLSIRGGAEHGIGIYVSQVEPGSLADRQGLCTGDQILSANQVNFSDITHEEAAKIIRSAKKLDLQVRPVGRVPGTYVVHQTYTWVDPRGRPVSPPPEVEKAGRYEAKGERKSGLMLLKCGDERKVNVVVGSGQSLGLMIRGGSEFGLGIYLTGVDPLSVAENAGLKVGDQILDVNGESFLDISHANAVKVLKASKHMIMTVKDVGRLPYARTTIDETQWIVGRELQQSRSPSRPSSALSNGFNSLRVKTPQEDQVDSKQESVFTRMAGSQLILNNTMHSAQRGMIEEQARQLLNDNERGTMNYYLNEYNTGHIGVEALALALFELLNTQAKFSLMSEVRGLIAPKDIDRFDALVLRRDVDDLKSHHSHPYTTTDGMSENSFDSSLSSYTGFSSTSAKDSVDGSFSHIVVPPTVPQQLPAHVKVKVDTVNAHHDAIEEIPDDSHGLPDYLRMEPTLSQQRRRSPSPGVSRSGNMTVAADIHAVHTSTPVKSRSHVARRKKFEEVRALSEDSGVDLNGHFISGGRRLDQLNGHLNNQQNSSSISTSGQGKKKRVTISPQRPVTINESVPVNVRGQPEQNGVKEGYIEQGKRADGKAYSEQNDVQNQTNQNQGKRSNIFTEWRQENIENHHKQANLLQVPGQNGHGVQERHKRERSPLRHVSNNHGKDQRRASPSPQRNTHLSADKGNAIHKSSAPVVHNSNNPHWPGQNQNRNFPNFEQHNGLHQRPSLLQQRHNNYTDSSLEPDSGLTDSASKYRVPSPQPELRTNQGQRSIQGQHEFPRALGPNQRMPSGGHGTNSTLLPSSDQHPIDKKDSGSYMNTSTSYGDSTLSTLRNSERQQSSGLSSPNISKATHGPNKFTNRYARNLQNDDRNEINFLGPQSTGRTAGSKDYVHTNERTTGLNGSMEYYNRRNTRLHRRPSIDSITTDSSSQSGVSQILSLN
ncbi:uncharacterized protein LOC106180619 [Lingula anatina]|uniref:Uncharacterized protein LOC106180619 n=1 Tax=Lingula anatina TaxID=7574 RepID=A0A1S3KBT9_LINAN|nr:uncharacterized protein LOC106180619 [Lingula anatina]|eukprot:XP_013420098.2 uncharacterized protein LOC106180619 [Lingula anatina]